MRDASVRLAALRPRSQPLVLAKFASLPFDEWQGPCLLDSHFLERRNLAYDAAEYDFAGSIRAVLGCENLGDLHNEPPAPPDVAPPALRRAQIQSRRGEPVTKAERKMARTHAWRHDRTPEWRAFMELYRKFVHEWVLPQFGDGPLLYQRKPILRVVMPGSVAPTALHCDADYFHSENELNFWVPLVAVDGRNSLYCESAPGAGDYSPFVSSGKGEAVRFYGNRCRHYTTANDAETTRVSFDFRCIPQNLFSPPSEIVRQRSKHALDPGSAKRGYYALAYPGGGEAEAGVRVGEQRRAWRELERA